MSYSVKDIPVESPPDCSVTSSEHDCEHLQVIDNAAKWAIISEWQDIVTKIVMVICAACSKRVDKNVSQWVEGSSMYFSLLCNTEIPTNMLPTLYDVKVYGGAILNAKGLESVNSVKRIRLCEGCYKSLTSGTVPKFALSNWLYYACERLPNEVKDAFDQSTVFDRMLCCRACYNSIMCKFNVSEETVLISTLNRAWKGIRGNIMVAPLDVFRMNNIIPLNARSIRDMMCAIFIGVCMPTKGSLSKFTPVLVRKSRVKLMIEFLLQSNIHYKPSHDFSYSNSNLEALLPSDEEQGIPHGVHIGSIPSNDAINSSTSDYTMRNVDDMIDEETDDLLMENVGYTDGDDSSSSYQIMKGLAVERCVRGKPVVLSGKGSRVVPDFNNPSILTWLFPHLDLWGIG